MASKGWKAYLTFTRKERTGVVVLLVLIGIVYAVPSFLPDRKSFYFDDGADSLQLLVAARKKGALSDDLPAIKRSDFVTPAERLLPATLFFFDPNNLDESGWKKLGIRERTIRTILNFRAKGGKFRLPADIRKIYGLSEDESKKLIPFIRITPTEKYPPTNKEVYIQIPQKEFRERRSVASNIDINLADSAAWEQLPAIGSRLASRIVFFRERLGGFYDIAQVAETFGVSDSAFEVIKPYLTQKQSLLRKMNINTADVDALKNHPYIKWNLANAIVRYRNQHGKFTDNKQLLAIAVITPAIYQKLVPYLMLE